MVFTQGAGNNGRPLLLLFPEQGPGLMPHVRYAAYMSLRLGDGTEVSELGQLIVTGDRVVGVFTRGAAGGTGWMTRPGRCTRSPLTGATWPRPS